MNRFLAIMVFVFFFQGVYGQNAFEFGAVGGFGFSNYTEGKFKRTALEVNPDLAFNIGGWTRFKVADWITLQADVRYVYYSSSFSYDFSKLNLSDPNDPAFQDVEIAGKIKESGIIVPVVVELGSTVRIRPLMGLQFGFFPGGKSVDYTSEDGAFALLSDDIDATGLSLVSGANYHLNNDVTFIELRAYVSLSERDNFNTISLQVGLGHRF